MTGTVDTNAIIDAIADAFFAAFVAQDADALERLYDPALVMTSPSGRRSGADHLRLVREGSLKVEDLHYEEVRRHTFAGGFVQQHLVCCVLPSGARMRKPACVVVGVSDGRIVTFDQYFDPAPLAQEPLYARLHDSTGRL